jgi:hypothetical protein
MAEVKVKVKMKMKKVNDAARCQWSVPRPDPVASACTLFRHCYAAYVSCATMQYFLVTLRSCSRLV